MVNSATSLGRSGLHDWIIQRFSAVILAAYTLCILGSLLTAGELDYDTWRSVFSAGWMRYFSVISILALCAHAWVGIWTVTTDYLTSRHMGPSGTAVRLIVQAACALVTVTYLLWGIQIFWGVN